MVLQRGATPTGEASRNMVKQHIATVRMDDLLPFVNDHGGTSKPVILKISFRSSHRQSIKR